MGALDGEICGPAMICLAGSCISTACGDGFVDERHGEQCEDGNVLEGDGCEPNCLWTCETNDDCDDGDLCTGAEVCQADHTCSNPPDIVCDDGNPCTLDNCHPLTACTNTLIDNDGDGVAAAEVGVCGAGTVGGDCDDDNPTVNPFVVDGCSDIGVDNDCDGLFDEDGADLWYADCDGDGVPALGAATHDSCGTPGVAPPGCGGGDWTLVSPAGSSDCDDSDASVHPGADEEEGNGQDDNCDGFEECYEDLDGDGYRTNNIVLTPDISCSGSGLATASQHVEWAGVAEYPCCDHNPAMNQGVASDEWFSGPNDFDPDTYEDNGNDMCPVGRRWDYDCDGTEERNYTHTVWSCGWGLSGCEGDLDEEGWYTEGAAPGCGGFGVWAFDCEGSGVFACSFDFDFIYQECH